MDHGNEVNGFVPAKQVYPPHYPSPQGVSAFVLFLHLHPAYTQTARVSSLGYGFPERFLTSYQNINVPHVVKAAANEQFKYYGALPSGNYIAFVDVSLNTTHPCQKTIAGAPANSRSSGAVKASAGSYTVTIPQNILLETHEDDGIISKYYAVCSAENNGDISDDTWNDSNIRLQMSKVATISAHTVTHRTSGQVAKRADLLLTFSGTLESTKWISLIDRTLNNKLPCNDSAEAAHLAGTVYSGPLQANANVITVDTEAMATTVSSGGPFPTVTATEFAVCYAMTGGTASDVWCPTIYIYHTYICMYVHVANDYGLLSDPASSIVHQASRSPRRYDSGIRLTVSKVATYDPLALQCARVLSDVYN